MATDWPTHGATNRFPHLPLGCGASLWFTANNDPPFAYRLDAQDINNPVWWVWTQFTHYIGIERDDLHAKWLRSHDVGGEVELWSMRFLTQGNPPTHHVELRADHFTATQVSSAENVVDLGVPEGTRISRGTIFFFPDDNWVELTNFPLDEGIPSVTIVATPIDCIPDWEPGDEMP